MKTKQKGNKLILTKEAKDVWKVGDRITIYLETNNQIDRLAKFIMEKFPEEPSRSEGAIDTAIRLLHLPANFKNLRDVINLQGQNGNWNYDPYMMGLYNGLEMARSIFVNKDPVFKDAPKKWLKDYPSIWVRIKWKLFGVPVAEGSNLKIKNHETP